MFSFFKRKKPEPPYDYGAALARLSAACQKCVAFSLVLPGVYYDTKKGKYVVHFECAQREYTNGATKKKYFLSTRRDEKLIGDDLETLLDFAVTYAGYDDAFLRSPQDNLPEGVTMQIKNIYRTPGGHVPSMPKWKLK